MSTVCARSLGTAGQPATSVRCQQWFADALSHCAQSLVVGAPSPSVVQPAFGLTGRLLQAAFGGGATDTQPAAAVLFMLDEDVAYKSDAHMLDQFECRHLLYRLAEDYVGWVGRREFVSYRGALQLGALWLAVLLLVGMLASVCLFGRRHGRFARRSGAPNTASRNLNRMPATRQTGRRTDANRRMLVRLLHRQMQTQPFTGAELDEIVRDCRMRGIAHYCDRLLVRRGRVEAEVNASEAPAAGTTRTSRIPVAKVTHLGSDIVDSSVSRSSLSATTSTTSSTVLLVANKCESRSSRVSSGVIGRGQMKSSFRNTTTC